MGKITSIFNRIYSDFFLPSRLKEYEDIIIKAKRNNFNHITINEYYEKLNNNTLGNQKYFIHRHDIDTDLRTTKKIFEIEKRQNIKSTYYFRLSTLDVKLMKQINEYGSEASYHFEEIATYCKNNKIKKPAELFKSLDEVKKEFKANFTSIEKQLGYKMTTVASHGDFVNRKLNIINNKITEDLHLRKELGIICETYDPTLKNSFDSYISDTNYPNFYRPKNIFEELDKHQVICFLSHPRHWESNIIENLKDNFIRTYEGVKYSLF